MEESFTTPQIFKKFSVQLRMKWVVEAAFALLTQKQEVVGKNELMTALLEVSGHLQIPTEHVEELMGLVDKAAYDNYYLLSNIGKLVIPEILTITESTSSTLQNKNSYIIWTESGKKYVTESEYISNYIKIPDKRSKTPSIWINLKTGFFSLWVGKQSRRQEINITGQKKDLLCMLLKSFNVCIPTSSLKEQIENYSQILNQLHVKTFNALKPFIEIRRGETCILKPYSKFNCKKEFTFCLIESL